jgi:hypothetical protein
MDPKIQRRIAMIQDTLQNGDLAPNQADRLRADLAILQNMNGQTLDAQLAQARITVNETKTPTAKRVGRGRAAKAAVAAPTAPPTPAWNDWKALPDYIKAATDAAHPVNEHVRNCTACQSLQPCDALGKAAEAVNTTAAAQVIVTVGEIKPVIFKRLLNGSWGVSGPADVIKTGSKVTVSKRDGSTTEVVVGNLIGRLSSKGSQLAYIDYNAEVK